MLDDKWQKACSAVQTGTDTVCQKHNIPQINLLSPSEFNRTAQWVYEGRLKYQDVNKLWEYMFQKRGMIVYYTE